MTGLALLDYSPSQAQASRRGGPHNGRRSYCVQCGNSQRLVRAGASRSGFIHGFLVRKAEKAHGTGRRIEGFFEKDAPVLIVDDVCTTGASTVTAIEAARESG